MKRDWTDWLGDSGWHLTLVLIILAVLLLTVGYIGNWKSCLSTYESYHPQFGFWSGCRIEWKGQLTPVDMIKNINVNQ